MRFLALTLLLTGSAISAMAGGVLVPEIDASSGASALALVSGGVLILRSRKNRK
jgi:hypothetical protein